MTSNIDSDHEDQGEEEEGETDINDSLQNHLRTENTELPIDLHKNSERPSTILTGLQGNDSLGAPSPAFFVK